MKSVSSFIPAYYRLAEDLKQKIESGELKPGDVIPSESQLAKQYQVSRMTVRQGVALLAKEGFIESIQGKGSFVTVPRMDTLVLRFSENNLLGESKTLQVKLLDVGVIAADRKISAKLAVSPGTRILKMKRLLLADEGPVAVDSRFLPYVKGVPLLEREMEYAAFPDLVARNTNLVSARNNFKVSASILLKEEAELLEAKVGLPALCVEQIIYASNDQPIGWSKMICRGDRFTLTAVSHPF
ncbi:GntR family transcriptional regulator [Candidatus Formimonas warabiya]|uniref:HTH gntR-type domain-containing protein n=1 Tax=Formimonas warabiya TaxID=1761012 RepID=A0A3G1KRV9_FORW1|nr:GntR family transcriptional regulator [Candidatus Formimonas warabiya]ATW25222.1 hypothetical protein DCMF_10990 [Candidatus Formimonas warabiya]